MAVLGAEFLYLRHFSHFCNLRHITRSGGWEHRTEYHIEHLQEISRGRRYILDFKVRKTRKDYNREDQPTIYHPPPRPRNLYYNTPAYTVHRHARENLHYSILRYCDGGFPGEAVYGIGSLFSHTVLNGSMKALLQLISPSFRTMVWIAKVTRIRCLLMLDLNIWLCSFLVMFV